MEITVPRELLIAALKGNSKAMKELDKIIKIGNKHFENTHDTTINPDLNRPKNNEGHGANTRHRSKHRRTKHRRTKHRRDGPRMTKRKKLAKTRKRHR